MGGTIVWWLCTIPGCVMMHFKAVVRIGLVRSHQRDQVHTLNSTHAH